MKTNTVLNYVSKISRVVTASLFLFLAPSGRAGQITDPTPWLKPAKAPQKQVAVSAHRENRGSGGKATDVATAHIDPPQKLAPGRDFSTFTRPQDPAQARMFDRIIRGDKNRKEIALTFDDGPHPRYNFTPRLLERLHELNVRVTFFLVGERVDQTPYLVDRMVREGHEVANHTYHHANLKKIPPDLVEDEIRLCNDAVQRASGVKPVFFRPPGGQYSTATVIAGDKMQLVTVLWTDDPGDYAHPPQAELEQKLLNHIRNGAVILLHDGVEETYDILPDLVARLRHEGYRFVTLTEMAQHLEADTIVH